MNKQNLAVKITIMILAAVTGSFFVVALGDCDLIVAIWILPAGAVLGVTTIAALLHPQSMPMRSMALVGNLAVVPLLSMPIWVTETAWYMLGVAVLLEPLTIDISVNSTAAMPRVSFLCAYLRYPRENPTLAARYAKPTAEQQEMIERVLWEANPYREK